MVNIDLQQLAAPIEALRPELDDAYKRLDAKWAEITKCLQKLPIPSSVYYTFDENPQCPEDYDCLAWTKYNGKKRICIVSYRWNPNQYDGSEHDISTTPYEEWSGQQRIAMLDHVPDLFAAAAKGTQEFIDQTKN